MQRSASPSSCSGWTAAATRTSPPRPCRSPSRARSSAAGGLAPPRHCGANRYEGGRSPDAQDENRIHGVFTWTLLNGLKHAVNAEQFITGESLRNYLLNSMKDFMPEEAKAGSEVSLEPYVYADPGIVFGPKRAPETQAGVRLTFPRSAVGKELRIWTGNHPHIVARGTIASDGFSATLGKESMSSRWRKAGCARA